MITEKESLKLQVNKVNRTLNDNDDLNTQKEAISTVMKEVEFLLGGQEEKYIESFSEVIIAMANFDFSKRVSPDESSSAIAVCLASGINMLCEEYQHTAIQKNVMKNILSSLTTNIDLLVLTDAKGFITFVNQQGNKLPLLEEKALYGCGINTIFDNFSVLDNLLKEGSNTKNIPVQLKWKGKYISASLTISISSNMGGMEAMIYMVRL